MFRDKNRTVREIDFNPNEPIFYRADALKEIKRKYVKDLDIVEEELPEIKIDKKPSVEDDGQKKIVKKKGVGYGNDSTTSGMNKQWDVAKYVDTKK